MGYVLVLDFGLLNVWAIQPEARGKAVHSSQIYMGGIKIADYNEFRGACKHSFTLTPTMYTGM